MICPIKHPRRYSKWLDQKTAERASALAKCMPASQAAKRLGMTAPQTEQLAARHGFAFLPERREQP